MITYFVTSIFLFEVSHIHTIEWIVSVADFPADVLSTNSSYVVLLSGGVVWTNPSSETALLGGVLAMDSWPDDGSLNF